MNYPYRIDNTMKKFLLASFAALTLAMGGSASATVITATGSGWCTTGECNASATDISNTFAGYSDSYRNFFSFDLSSLTGTVLTATLNIWNDDRNAASSTQSTYTVRQAASVNYASFGTGTVLGAINASQADNGVGHYVSIVLNSAALAALTASEGHSFLFGGVSNDAGTLFGYTSGSPVATLTVTTGAAVPEPAGVALMGLGLVAALVVRRRKA
jgi:hypothetical protein